MTQDEREQVKAIVDAYGDAVKAAWFQNGAGVVRALDRANAAATKLQGRARAAMSEVG